MRRFPFCLLLLCLLPASLAQTTQPQSRITRAISTGEMVPIEGGRHPIARLENDRGRMAASEQLHGVTLTFKRSDAQQHALDRLIADQQDPASANYHKWLTPQQFGAAFGMSDADLSKVAGWLESQGLTVDEIAPSKNSLHFSGSVAQVEAAFAMEMHVFQAGGETHFANATAPSVPAALAGVVLGVRNLDDFRPKPNYRPGRQIPMEQRENSSGVQPQFTNGAGNHFLTPGDFSVIYDINTLAGSGFTGSGQTIGVMGQSAVDLAQIAAFQTGIGQSLKAPTLLLVPGSGNSTPVSGDEGESEIDLEYSGGIAQGATIVFVFTGSSQNFNVFDALAYAVQHKTAQVLTMSYSTCEALNSQSVLASLDSVLQQSVAQGQTIMTSSGDSGAAACDLSSVTSATHGLSANYPASSVFVTGVGGTRFNEGGDPSFWNTSKPVSATKYIPEEAWNDTGDPTSNGTLASTGGGPSKYFAKPTWQVGPGVPQDGFRDMPDVSFAASGVHDGYIFCSSDTNGGRSDNKCANGTLGNAAGFLSLVGGTSLSSPSFAGAVAILNQKLGSSQGLLNPRLYSFAASSPTPFHDVTQGDNRVPCTAGSTDCDTTGLVGYVATPGYDLPTGLGSVDINALAQAFAGPLPSTLTLTVTPTTVGQNNVVTFTATVNAAAGTPTGIVTFVTSNNVTVGTETLSGGVASVLTISLPVGVSTVTAQYSGDLFFSASTSAAMNVNVTAVAGQSSTALTVTPATSTSGTPVTFKANVTGTGTGTPTGTVTFLNNLGGTVGTAPLVAGVATLTMNPFAGTFTVVAQYSGDAKFSVSSSLPVNLTVNLLPTTTALTATPTSATVGQAVSFTATVSHSAGAAVPQGTVTLSIDSGQPTGGGTLNATGTATFSVSNLSTGTHSIVALYSGDGTYAASASPAISVTVAAAGSYTLSVNPTSVSLASKSSGGTSTLTVTPSNGFTGTVALSCTVAGAAGAVAPTCSVPASVNVSSSSAVTATVTIGSIAGNTKLAATRTKPGWMAMTGVAFAGAVFLGFPGRRRKWAMMFALLTMIAVAGGVGCGGGGGGGGGGGTTSGTYTATITGTSGALTGSTTLTVVVP